MSNTIAIGTTVTTGSSNSVAIGYGALHPATEPIQHRKEYEMNTNTYISISGIMVIGTGLSISMEDDVHPTVTVEDGGMGIVVDLKNRSIDWTIVGKEDEDGNQADVSLVKTMNLKKFIKRF